MATEGFLGLTAALDAVPASAPVDRLTALGRAYDDFGVAHPALFDLMFRTVELNAADPDLRRAQEASIAPLTSAAAGVGAGDPATLTVLAWALVHGLVVLTHDGALRETAYPTDAAATVLAYRAIATFGNLIQRI